MAEASGDQRLGATLGSTRPRERPTASSAACLRIGLLAAALATAFSLDAHALDPAKHLTQFPRRVWLTADGLPDVQVQTILRSREGYLWVGTMRGLARFDGLHFTTFDRRTTPALGGDSIWALLETRDGTLWVGALGGLSRYKDGRWTAVTRADGLGNEQITALREARDGSVWIGTESGLYRTRPGGRVEAVTTKDGPLDEHVHDLLEDPDGTLWIGTSETGLVRINASGVRRYTTRDGLVGNDVRCLSRGPDRALWIGTRQGLSRYDGAHFRNYGKKDGLSNEYVHSLAWDGQGALWIATGGGGLDRMVDGRFSVLNSPPGLARDDVDVVYEDREGIIWFGSALSRLADEGFSVYAMADGLPTNEVWSSHEDGDGTFWVATSLGLAGLKRGGQVVTYSVAQGLPSDSVLTLAEGYEGSLWIGTRGGVRRLKNGTLTPLPTAQRLSSDDVRALQESRDGSLWIGTAGGGLNRLQDGRLTVYTTKDGLASNLVLAVREARNGTLWVGTTGGLSRREGERFRTFRMGDGLPADRVIALWEDQEGSLWIGTPQGLARYRDGRFKTYTTADGLPDDFVCGITDDTSGGLWVGSARGPFRVAKRQIEAFDNGLVDSLTPVVYTPEGVNGAVQNSATRGLDGRLFFATEKGLIVIDSTETARREAAPVMIETVQIDRRIAASGPQPPGRGELEFHYTALDLMHPERITFKYLLEGFDREWTNAGPRLTAHYTNIPPGHYRFRVVALSNDGNGSQNESSFDFVLEPHLYEARWFQGLCLIGLALGLIGLHWRRVRSLRARARTLSLLVEERTQAQRALEESNHRLGDALDQLRRTQEQVVKQERLRGLGNMASGIAHDFNNALAPIVGYSDLLLARREKRADPELVEKYIQIINTAAQDAAHIVGRLREFYRRRSENEPGRRVDLGRLVGQVVALCQPKWKDQPQAAGITIAVRMCLEPVPPVCANESDLREALTNVVFNAVDAMPHGGTITFLTRHEGDLVVLEVRDTGTGMTPEVRERCLDPFFTTKGDAGTGLGLAMVYGILKQYDGSVEIQSAPGAGTSVLLRLPLQAASAAEGRPAEEPVKSEPLRVLVCDDEPVVCDVVRCFLEEDGHHVVTAGSGAEALVCLEASEFDVLLVDRAMPGMSGDQVARAAKSRRAGLPVILLTGFGSLMNASGERPEGIDVVLGKPVVAEDLRQALVRARRDARAREAVSSTEAERLNDSARAV
jgi:ligand-binding sensor domain-containing protein/signal transduction histidine kinase/CheY-like chemotaxis protein